MMCKNASIPVRLRLWTEQSRPRPSTDDCDYRAYLSPDKFSLKQSNPSVETLNKFEGLVMYTRQLKVLEGSVKLRKKLQRSGTVNAC
jgi:hypothetical protein